MISDPICSHSRFRNLFRSGLLCCLLVVFAITSFSQDVLPSVRFKSNSAMLLPSAKAMLVVVANKMKANPGMIVKVQGYSDASKSGQQLSWDRVNNTIAYLAQSLQISADRFIFLYGNEGGAIDTVDLTIAEPGEEGPKTSPRPGGSYRRT